MLDFSDGSVVKNSPANTEDTSSIPGPGRPQHATEQLNPSATAAEPAYPRAHASSKRSHCNEKHHDQKAAPAHHN